jgi:hypothetical protein
MKIEIEKGIPIPSKNPGNRWGRGGAMASAFRSMNIGDSFVVSANKLPSIYQLCKRNGWKVKVQSQEKDIGNLRAVRVWKILANTPGKE